jgi:signal transduction histidine kinase
VPADVEAAAYRIAQEVLTNVERHAQADAARVDLAVQQGELTLEVT